MYSDKQTKKFYVFTFLIVVTLLVGIVFISKEQIFNIETLVKESDYVLEKNTEFQGFYTQGLEYQLINSNTEYQVSQGSAVFERSITIPDYWNGIKITSIGAFDKCELLEKITIPLGIKSIGDYAFSNCINLTSITIPSEVTSIGECAFYKSGIKIIDMKPVNSPILGLYCFQYTAVSELNIPLLSKGYDVYPWNTLSEI